MKAIIFTEASNVMGLGHLRRCEALSEILQRQGISVCLHVSSSVSELESLKPPCGYDVAVVDSYHLPVGFYEQCVRACEWCVFFDDTLRLEYPKEGIILNGALGANKLSYPKGNLWLGTPYALFNQAFQTLSTDKVIHDKPQSILLSFGGGELAQRYIPILTECLYRYDPSLEILALNPSMGLDSKGVRMLMDRSCIALSAAGGTLNELAVCGVPSLAFCIVENQRFNFEAWKELGFPYCEHLPGEVGFEEEFLEAFKRLQSHSLRQTLSHQLQQLIQENAWQTHTFLELVERL